MLGMHSWTPGGNSAHMGVWASGLPAPPPPLLVVGNGSPALRTLPNSCPPGSTGLRGCKYSKGQWGPRVGAEALWGSVHHGPLTSSVRESPCLLSTHCAASALGAEQHSAQPCPPGAHSPVSWAQRGGRDRTPCWGSPCSSDLCNDTYSFPHLTIQVSAEVAMGLVATPPHQLCLHPPSAPGPRTGWRPRHWWGGGGRLPSPGCSANPHRMVGT